METAPGISRPVEAPATICISCAAGVHDLPHAPGSTCTCACNVKPRAFYECAGCGEEFRGPNAAKLWIDHTAPRCARLAAREKLAREDLLRRDRQRKAQDDAEARLGEAFGAMVDLVGLQKAMEALGRSVESWDGDRRWQEVAATIFELSGQLDKDGYGELER